MTKTKTTKRALLTSVLSMMLCMAMLVGSTFAWFTDSVTSGKNKIVAGNLDVELNWSADGKTWERVKDDTDMFKDTLWEPGYTRVVYLQVENVGSLALKYQFGINVAGKVLGETADGDPIDLANFIKFGVVNNATPYSADNAGRTAAREAVKDSAVLISAGYASAEGHLSAKTKSATIALVVYMPEDVENGANHGTGKQAPEIYMGINLVATQDTVEKDSFGTDYDADAKYPEVAGGDEDWYDADKTELTISTANQLIEFAKLVNDGEAFANKTITLANDIALDGVSNWTPIGTSDHPFMGTFDGAGHTVSGMMINRESTEDVGFFGTIFGAKITHLTVSGNITVGTSSLIDDNDYHIGGICAWADGNSVVEKCTNKTNIKVADNELEAYWPTIYIGGIVGAVNSGSISDCLNTGSITSDELYPAAYVGGITSILSGGQTVKNSVNVGEVTGGYISGGIVGGGIAGRAPVNSYSMNVPVMGGPNPVVTSADDMKTQSTFVNFDFDTVWELTNGMYPTLK